METEKKFQRTSPFVGRSDGVCIPGQKFKSEKDSVIYDFSEVASVVKTGEGEHDFIIRKKLVISGKKNRSDFINSFSGDVGIMNVLKKVAIGGQSLCEVIESGKYVSKQGFVDVSKMPSNIVDAYKAVEQGVEAFDKLPDALKKEQSFAHFATATGKKQITDYINSEVAKAIAAARPQVKGDKKDE